MATQDEPIRIIGNESNTQYEVETTEAAATPTSNPVQATASDTPSRGSDSGAERGVHELTTNDGSLIETFDTAFHNKPGVAEGEEPSGSNRADYYEAQSQGASDAEEELSTLNGNQPQ